MLDRSRTPLGEAQIQRPASPPAGSVCLQARGLVLDVDGKRLIDGIDLTIERARFTAIMGPNGAGKSVLLRLLHGLATPTAGTIAWFGEPLGASVRARQALVFQRPVLLRRSVAANIDFVLALKGKADSAMRDALLERVGLLDHSRQPARLLSGGEQQRLALARALATSPRVLFLDEPTASLDPASTAMIESIVADACAQGVKIILVTHNPGQAKRLADEILFLNRGRLIEHTPAIDFFNAPSSTEAAAFLDGRLLL